MGPKKGINTKAAAALSKKAEVQSDKAAVIQKNKEDEEWRDDDKLSNKKLTRKAINEQKTTETLQKKAELKKLYEDEMTQAVSAAAAASSKKIQPSKMTQKEIQQQFILKKLEEETKQKEDNTNNNDIQIIYDLPLQENINQMQREEKDMLSSKGVEYIGATGLDEAVSALNINNKTEAVDIHPEKRMKAAWLAYEEVYLPLLKIQHPTLKRSQILQILHKQWKTSSENPLYNKS
eukprot:GHVR01180229.1.p1 GENE.GHVR01180229.1~~GHVR01180229.1.p1  ORF type:complete len:235 (+),score=78.44 GHVR01180229.1:100-804(+)